MATYDDMSLPVRVFMKAYPFSRYRIAPVPCAPLQKRISEARSALVTSAGYHTPEQPGFARITIGDPSFREIPGDVAVHTLIESHNSTSFDHAGVLADQNLALPLDRFRELERRGEIGELNRRHFSFMGSIVNPRKLMRETAPEVARLLREDGVDAVLLTPV